jgi:hypothetical protein
MYRRPKFLEILLEIREQMSRDADYDMDLFAEMVRSGKISENEKTYNLNESKTASDKEKDSEKVKSKVSKL